jgi:hypothetical protein
MAQGAPNRVLSLDEKHLVRRELARVVESAAFRQSKRCCRLLTHIVEAALNDTWDALRERNLGVELFNRPPDYGTTEDAVVRVAAAETRKRLAQYYDQAGQIEGIRIELPIGGYVPEFRFQETPLPVTIPRRSHFRWFALAAVVALILLAVFVWSQRLSPVDHFWQPLARSKDPVLVALGIVNGINGGVADIEQFRARALESCKTPAGCEKFFAGVHPIARGNIPTGDAIGLGHMMGYLGNIGKAFRIRGVLDITYSNIKEEDAILVGYFSNPWTIELHQRTRFALVHDASGYYVADRQNPSSRAWTMQGGGWPRMRNQEDYALITRVTDPQTRRTHYTAAGFTPFGTEAAAALLGDPAKLNEFLSALPSGWPSKNLQLVVHTRVKSMIPGPPQLVASHVW